MPLKIIERLFSLFAALLFLQIPLFMQLYENQLIGHVKELQWQVEAMAANAKESQKTLDQYISKFVNDSDLDVSNQGMIMQKVNFRWNKLATALDRLKNAAPFTKPFVFFFYLEYEIFQSTFKSFKPGLPMTFEGFIYGMAGTILCYFVFCIFKKNWVKEHQ